MPPTPPTPVLVRATCLALAFVVVHCGSSEASIDNDARCNLNSDCKSPLICGFERCRAQCTTSSDCGGKLCVQSGNGRNFCQLGDEVQCTHNSQCVGTQICGRDGRCRDACLTDKDCVKELVCSSHVCAKREELAAGELPTISVQVAGIGCTYATDCPGSLVCLSGRCDVECLGDKDCLIGWACRTVAAGSDGRCFPPGGADASVE